MKNTLPPPPALRHILRNALPVDVPPGHYHIPASLYPTLLVILRGGITLHHHGAQPFPRLILCGGTRTPRHAEAAPGTRLLILPLRHGTLPALFGIDAGHLMENWTDWQSLVPQPAALHPLLDALATENDTHTIATLWHTLEHIAARQTPHQPFAIPVQHLHQPLADLSAQFALSPRQFERRFLSAYGQSLRAYRRQWRCSQLLPALLAPANTLADIALAHGFHDQSHMQRDIRQFTGHTPAALRRAVAQQQTAAWAYQGMQRHPQLFGTHGF